MDLLREPHGKSCIVELIGIEGGPSAQSGRGGIRAAFEQLAAPDHHTTWLAKHTQGPVTTTPPPHLQTLPPR